MCLCKMPFSDTYLNILDLCRLCLDKDCSLIPVFDNSLNVQLCDKISICLAVQIKAEDRVSQKICNSCLSKVNSFYEFRNKTSESQTVLQKCLNEANEKQLQFEIKEDATLSKSAGNEVKEELLSEQTKSEESDDSENDCESRSDYDSSNSESDESSTLNDRNTLHTSNQSIVSDNGTIENDIPGPSGVQLGNKQLPPLKLEEPIRHKNETSTFREKKHLSKIKIKHTDNWDKSLKKIQNNFNSFSQIQFVPPDVANEETLIKSKKKVSKLNKELIKKKFECNLCHFSARYKSQLDIHIKRHKKDYKIFCNVCHKGFFYQNEIEMHKALHEERNRFQCTVCQKTFVYRHSLVSHARKHSDVSKPQEIYQCDKCDKTFSDKSYLKRHIQVHTGVNRVVCEVCGQLLCSPGALRSHRLTHTGERPFSCTICGKAFTTKKYMMIHRRIHTGIKPYKCQQCGKSFSQQSTLIVHKRYHSGEKPYQCQVCNKAFVTKTILKIHQKNHTL